MVLEGASVLADIDGDEQKNLGGRSWKQCNSGEHRNLGWR